jgi:ResB-like family
MPMLAMLLKRLVKIFTSLRLTVILLAFAIVLVFVGTLAQVDEGLYNAQARYFRQWLIFGLDLFGHKIPLILPGGYLIGTMLLLNLVCAHIYRFQLSIKKIGIQLAHAGVILLLLGQLTTDMLAHESQISFAEGQTKSFAESPLNYELVFTSANGANSEQVVAIPGKLLARGGEIQSQNLPFTIRVKSYWKNSEPQFRAPMMQNGPPLTTNGVALDFDFHPAAEVKTMDDKNVPTAEIEIADANGSLGDWIVSDWTADDTMISALRQSYEQQLGADMAQKIVADLTHPQFIFAGGKKFTFALRPQRIYFPFSLTLLKATHTVYEGTDIPKDFRSRVQLQNPQTGENREVEISMNHPLRYDGLTFYQYQMDAGEAAAQAGRVPSSVLQVVHNPSWLTPYIGCAMVAAGLVTQFMFHLVGFISKRKTK